MKVLWFTNILMPAANRHLGRSQPQGTGTWMSALLDQLKTRRDLQLAVVCQGGLRDCHFEAEGVEYFVVGTPWRTGLRNRLGSYKEALPVKSQIKKFASIVNEWNPHVVHVHGTESGYGLIKAWNLTNKPVAVSIQGLMGPYSAKAYGELQAVQLHGRLRTAIGVGLSRWRSFVERTPFEESIIRSADMILGRTQWDQAWAWAYRPDVRYRHVNELMRSEFFQAVPWSLASCRRRQIFCTSQSQPLKGLHVLLEAVYRLRQVYPDVKLAIASDGFLTRPYNDYVRYLFRLIREWNLGPSVTFLGSLDAAHLVEQLQAAHCYVTPSFIENGCNALQEAMLVGTPSVATLSGGLLTTIDPERTGLAFPTGDAALSAWQIARIFREDGLAARLGAEGRIVARERHNPLRVEAQLLAAYEELAGSHIRPPDSPGIRRVQSAP